MEVQSQFIEMFGDFYTSAESTLADYVNLKAGKSKKAELIRDSQKDAQYPCYGGNGIRGYVDDFTHNGTYCIIGRQGALCGNVQIAHGQFYATEHAVVVSPIVEINTTWLFFALTQMNLNQYARGVAQPGLAVNQIEKLSFSLPSLDGQNRFASIAEQADKSKFVGFKSQFIEMLSNSGYEEKSLGELCDKITDGSHNPPKGNDGSEYLMISSKNVFIDGLDLADVRYLSKDEFDLENKRTEVKKNDILLTIVGTIGRTYLVKGNEGNIVMQRSVAVLKPSDKVNPLFMMYSLHIDENLEKEGRGNAQKGVYLKQLSQFKIKVPSLDIQNNFCSIYQQADKSKFELRKSLEAIDAVIKSLINN